MKKLFWIALVLLFGAAAFAQDAPAPQAAPTPPTTAQAARPVEALPTVVVAVDYSFLRFPQNNFISSFNLNGGGASVAYYFNKHIGLHADFQDYGSHTLNFSVPGQTINCISQSNCPLSASGTAFTYTVGPIVRFRVKRFEPFVEVMFGGAHDNSYANIYKACINQGSCLNLSKQPNNNAFTWVLGGGIDIPFKEHIAIRPAQVDYVPTHFGDGLQPSNMQSGQNNLRYQAGIVFKF